MPFTGQHLLEQLGITSQELGPPNRARGVFGICYSILTWSGVGKGLRYSSVSSWGRSLGKLIENGHATTFLIDGTTLTLTGMSDQGWVFNSGGLNALNWARETASANTYVYYILVDEVFMARYRGVCAQLVERGARTSYALLQPNNELYAETHRYENCVSHCHYLMWELGLAYWVDTKGWWMPSIRNWVDWFKRPLKTGYNGFKWGYCVVRNADTHFPSTNDQWQTAAAPMQQGSGRGRARGGQPHPRTRTPVGRS